jgi:hypothetical protein
MPRLASLLPVAALALLAATGDAQQQQRRAIISSKPSHVAAASSLAEWAAAAFLGLPCYEDAEPRASGGHGALVHGHYRVSASNHSATPFHAWEDFAGIVGGYLQEARKWLTADARWPLDGAFGSHRMRKLFHIGAHAPFVQRLELPPGSVVAVFGDLHGALHSLIRSLQSLVDAGYLTPDLTVAPAHARTFHVLVLGDFVDRGHYGAETLALLLSLKVRNPGNVWLARGNHEDENMNTWGSGAFTHELHRKFGASSVEFGVPLAAPPMPPPSEGDDDNDGAAGGPLRVSVYRVYDTLPAAIFLGVMPPAAAASDGDGGAAAAASATPRPAFLQCCHGGIEVGFDPTQLLTHECSASGGNVSGATADGDDDPLASGGARVRYALMHGYARGDWLASLPPALRAKLPHRVQALMRNVGYAADVNAARRLAAEQRHSCGDGTSDVSVGADGSATPAAAASAHPHLVDPLGVQCGWDDDEHEDEPGTADDEGADYGDAGAWPVAPTHGDLGNGFMWSDFITHDAATSLLYQRGRGLAFGLPVTAHLTKSTPVAGFLRAHQHNNAPDSGPMLDAVADAGGAFDNWNASGHVMTFLSGAHIPHLGFGRDSYGLLTLPTADPASWTLSLCGQDVGGQYIAGVDADPPAAAEGGADGAGDDDDGSKLGPLGRGWRSRLAVAHACNARRDTFACRPLPWRVPARR